jgi:hypothetical protein
VAGHREFFARRPEAAPRQSVPATARVLAGEDPEPALIPA